MFRTRHSLIIANGRTGSTWVVTNFDRFPDTRARGELKLKTDSVKDRSGNWYIGSDVETFRQAIDVACFDPNARPADLFVSKLIFEPYEYNGPSVFARIKALSGRHTNIFLLKRRYLECWLSWKARGVYHEIDRDVLKKVGGWFPGPKKPETVDIVLHHGGAAMSDGPDGAIAYPLISAIDDLLMFFNNDIHAKSVARAVMNYDQVPVDMPRLARMIGSKISPDEMVEILASPLMVKLPSLDDRLRPAGVLNQIASILDAAFWSVADGRAKAHDLWRWQADGTVRLNIAGLAPVLAQYGISVSDGRAVIWAPQKPVAAL